jgi:Leucine-rich repeat (LRR) protein
MIDGFKDKSQFKFISKCKNLINLSQSSSDLSCVEHLTKLKKLEVFECCSNLLSDLSYFKLKLAGQY